MPSQPAPADVVHRENLEYLLGYCAGTAFRRVRVTLRDGAVLEGKATFLPPNGVALRLCPRRILERPWEVTRAPLREVPYDAVLRLARLVPHRGRQAVLAAVVAALSASAGALVPLGANDHPFGWIVLAGIVGLLVGTVGALLLDEVPPFATWEPLFARDDT